MSDDEFAAQSTAGGSDAMMCEGGEGDQMVQGKTDYWIQQLDLARLLAGSPLGVAEHQAELRLRKMEKWDAEHPNEVRYTAERSRLKTHLKRVTVCKQLRPLTIVHLRDDEYGAAILHMGVEFGWPDVTREFMVVRRCQNLRALAQESGAPSARWSDFFSALLPPVLGGGGPAEVRPHDPHLGGGCFGGQCDLEGLPRPDRRCDFHSDDGGGRRCRFSAVEGGDLLWALGPTRVEGTNTSATCVGVKQGFFQQLSQHRLCWWLRMSNLPDETC